MSMHLVSLTLTARYSCKDRTRLRMSRSHEVGGETCYQLNSYEERAGFQ
jgi:hypothetical protein